MNFFKINKDQIDGGDLKILATNMKKKQERLQDSLFLSIETALRHDKPCWLFKN